MFRQFDKKMDTPHQSVSSLLFALSLSKRWTILYERIAYLHEPGGY